MMRPERILVWLVVLALAAPASAARESDAKKRAPAPSPAPSAPAPARAPEAPSAPDGEKALAIRAALVDSYSRLADLVLAARLPDGRTVGAALGPGSDGEVALRLMLRTGRMIGDPRVYSDGVAEVDVEMSFDALAHKVAQLCGLKGGPAQILPDLRAQSMDGYLRVEGCGRAPRDLVPEVAKKVEAARPEDVVEMFPMGWERTSALGRVDAVRQARVRAYAAMGETLRAIRLGPTRTIGELAASSPAAGALFDAYLRGLPVLGEARMMPDRIAEVDVAVPVRDLLKVLRDMRALAPADERLTEDQIDQLSINLKSDRLVVTGCGMPPPDQIKPEESLPAAPGPSMPDWAAWVLEARGVARRPDDIEDEAQARLLTVRSAKARAMADMERQLDAVRLDDGRTVRDRAAKDDVFRRDIAALLASARPVKYEQEAGGKHWEVVVRLPLVRLWEFSRPRE